MATDAATIPDSMTRPWNFSAGPAMLPQAVLDSIRDELTDYRGSGISMLEMGHRTEIFSTLMAQTEADLRVLMDIPERYAVLFLHGGASLQFAMAPLNLLGSHESASYVNTGLWSAKAIKEASLLCRVHVAADASVNNYTAIPPATQWHVPADSAFLHYTVNETIGGMEFHWVPHVEQVPLVADMTSMILSRPIEVRHHAMIYAGAQKNLGIAGLTLVIVDREALHQPPAATPSMLNLLNHVDAGSLYNTPPVFAWYVTSKMLGWVKAEGGVNAFAERNRRKAAMLYEAIDASNLYQNPIQHECRSWMSVPFTLADHGLEALFLREAAAAGLLGLAGHRSMGGLRACLYNAMPEAGVRQLVEFMREFERVRA
ncbi:MAG: 3-phosphoserine/phosphohydroxythreonine transaminase [Gammaproteobacteria bacterium]